MKDIIGLVAVALTFIGYVPYMRDTITGKTRPHVYTWFIWSLASFIAFGLQVSDNAGPGAWVTAAAGMACVIIFALGMRQGDKDITALDAVFLLLAILALVLWIFAKQPVLSIILASATELLAFLPTVRKSWARPHEETLISYTTNVLRFSLALIALNRYTVITSLYHWSWLCGNAIFSVLLIYRRRQLAKD